MNWSGRYYAAGQTASTRSASASSAGPSTCSPPSPSGRVSPYASWSRAISCSSPIAVEESTMSKLKLSAIEDDKPVKLTIELPATVHRDLAVYAEALGQGTGKAAVEPVKLIPPMLARFMATDRAFAKLRRTKSKQSA